MQKELLREVMMEDESASVWYYANEKIVHNKTHKFYYGEKYREILTKIAEIFESKECEKLLSDDRNNSAIRNIDIEWGEQNWRPRMLKAGWKKWAILLPEKSVGKMSIRRVVDDGKKYGIVVEVFEDENKAFEWLVKS